jgi:hypothetical protein
VRNPLVTPDEDPAATVIKSHCENRLAPILVFVQGDAHPRRIIFSSALAALKSIRYETGGVCEFV